ncbi:response regulator transcription factor [Marinobacterium arenosum]|uniref:response regulator transcription factor n=1 Tax=Marinobacterium arenosum TaxID=2862496 RepID=UPI001C946BC5|nr:response regulator [Marinobacterium arenosum]MBY4678325.1 response regulator [Marinobacterium arenosum]
MSDSSQPIVYVVDDDADVRDSLQWLLESVGLRVQSFGTAQAFFDGYPAGQSGCLVMDVRMPGLSGLSAQTKLAELAIDIPVIMISAHGNVDMAVTAMTQGALTFIEKPFNDQLLLDQVQAALQRDQQRRQGLARKQQLQQRYDSLTKREKQVFERVVQGLTNNEIADQLAINRKTVEGHRAHMMNKMAAESLPELIQMALSLGLVGAY